MEPLRGINTCKEIYKKNKEKYFKPKFPLTLNLSKAFLNLIFALSKYFNNWGGESSLSVLQLNGKSIVHYNLYFAVTFILMNEV